MVAFSWRYHYTRLRLTVYTSFNEVLHWLLYKPSAVRCHIWYDNINSTFTLQFWVDGLVAMGVAERVTFCESCKSGTSCICTVPGLLPTGLVSASKSWCLRPCFWLITHLRASHFLSQFILPPVLIAERSFVMTRKKQSATAGSWAITATWWPSLGSFLKNLDIWHLPLPFQ